MNLRALLILGRVSNLPTVWSNLMAGWMLNGGGLEPERLALLLLGGSLLYTGGMYLNDYCDADFDVKHCPQRPIPSHRISRHAVGFLTAVWFASGLACLAPLGLLTVEIALGLVGAIVLYNLRHKDFVLAPLVMGFCRFLLYPLAASAANAALQPHICLLGAALGLYVAGITYLARGESRPGKPVRWAIIWLVLPVALAIEIFFQRPVYLNENILPLLLFSLGLLGWQAWLLIPFWRGTNRSIGRVVSGLLAAIVLVDALLLVPLRRMGGTLDSSALPPRSPLATLRSRDVRSLPLMQVPAPSLERTITVSFAHRIYFTHAVFSPQNPTLAQILSPGKALVVLDREVARVFPQLPDQIAAYFADKSCPAKLVAPPLLAPGGEAVKNTRDLVDELYREIERHGIDRHSYLIAIGGGALLDAAGFAAATAHRGVRHLRLPTTSLSQADGGVGVKNGINAFGKKNFIGTFAPPFAIINDSDFLEPLPAAEKRAGLIEAIKVALIRDSAFFAEIEKSADTLARFESDAMDRAIRRCAELHVEHIATSGDPFELGSARPLDFGHWSAHKLEQMSGFAMSHGAAVAHGVALERHLQPKTRPAFAPRR